MKNDTSILVIVGVVVLLVFLLIIGVSGELEVKDEFEIKPVVVLNVSEKSVVEKIEKKNIDEVVQVVKKIVKEYEDDDEDIKEGNRVTYVVDGDTLEIDSGERVRLLCIDTPEEGEYYYNEASDYLESLVLGEEVELVDGVSDVDKYGRLLRFVYVGDLFVNEKMVRGGYARAYLYSSDATSCSEIEAAESEARDEGLGIWEGQVSVESESGSGNYVCSSDFYNCGDFDSHSEAQGVFEVCGGVDGDVHRLDGDGDGVACEGLK